MSTAEMTMKRADKPQLAGEPGKRPARVRRAPPLADKRRQVASFLHKIETSADALARSADELLARLA